MIHAMFNPSEEGKKSQSVASVALAAPGTSDFIVIPENTDSIMIGIAPGAASSAYYQYTNSTIAACVAGTATWFNGEAQTAAASEYTEAPITAIRLVVTAGIATLTVTAA